MSVADSVLHAAPRVAFLPGPTADTRVTDRRTAALLTPGAPAFEHFRVLRTKVHALDAERPLRRIGVVAASHGEGTTTVALGLAAALAQESGRRVLYVESDVRARQAESVLGLSEEAGLREWIESPAPLALRRVAPWGFSFLGAGTPPPTASELLASDAMRRLLASAGDAFDSVVVDCPPLDAVADAVVLQEHLDGFLLVVRSRHASRDTVLRAVARLSPGAVRGVVFNDRTEILTRWLDRSRPGATPKRK